MRRRDRAAEPRHVARAQIIREQDDDVRRPSRLFPSAARACESHEEQCESSSTCVEKARDLHRRLDSSGLVAEQRRFAAIRDPLQQAGERVSPGIR